jgi:hypothetical protein
MTHLFAIVMMVRYVFNSTFIFHNITFHPHSHGCRSSNLNSNFGLLSYEGQMLQALANGNVQPAARISPLPPSQTW